MCHGHLDPKYALREMEARLKDVAFRAEARPSAAPGWLSALRLGLARLTHLRAQAADPGRRGV